MVAYTCPYGRENYLQEYEMKNINKTTKRGMIKSILNRGNAYRLSVYARLVSNMTGREITKSDILCSLNHMQKEGQFTFNLHREFVISRKVA